MNKLNYEVACTNLKQGNVIAYPTEAVWGLGCDPHNQQAVHRILKIKKRTEDKGLILVAADLSQLGNLLVGLSEDQLSQLHTSWPGPTTWLIPDHSNQYPVWIKGSHTSVAIRISAHPVVTELCKKFGGPIVSTSANLAGEPEIRSRLILEERFTNSIDYVLPGELGTGRETSQIRDLITGRLIR